MRNRELLLIVFGFILIGIGVSLFALSSTESSNSIFYIFPFFFFTTSGNSGIIVMIILMVSFAVFSFFIMTKFSNSLILQKSMTSCHYCEDQIPIGSRFCPRCGKQIETEGVNY